ncbi:MAG: hypothetical protein ACXW2P_09760 [Thermoanaerobaculia bacterium]
MTRILFAVLAFVVVAGTPPTEPSQRSGTVLPSRLEGYLANVVRPTPAERRRLFEGTPIAKLMSADESKEVAVFGAIWINAPIRRYAAAVQDIENFERGGGFRITKRISAVPRLEDFAQLHLPKEDVADLRTCRVGDCVVKLGEAAIQKFRREVDWRAPDAQARADAVMQRLAFEYATGYLEGGNERLAVYRDASRPTRVAEEFRAMVDQMPELTSFMPNLRRYLLEYPKESLPDATSFLYWQETDFGLRPTIRISHLTIREGPDETVVASKMLYASHYFWTGLELRALLPDPSRGPGFWLVTVNRSRSDGLGGFTGFFVRRRVRSEVLQGASAGLQATKRMLERIP